MRDSVDRAMLNLAAGLRKHAWRMRRAASRRRRLKREGRGDFTQSHAASMAGRTALAQSPGRGPGFFVEEGANDGFLESKTYELERGFGWRGLLVEPAPELARAARLARPDSHVVCCALVGSGFDRTHITLGYAAPMTRIGQIADHPRTLATDAPSHLFHAPARTLTSLLDEVGRLEVDFLSLDVEGYRAAAPGGLAERHAPRIVLVEVGDRDERREDVERVLGSRYEVLNRPTGRDLLCRRLD